MPPGHRVDRQERHGALVAPDERPGDVALDDAREDRGHQANPPDADHAAPVTYEAPSPTRKRTTSAISVASAIRPTGIWVTIMVRTGPSIASSSGVSTHPGHTAFTRMPSGATSCAAALVR